MEIKSISQIVDERLKTFNLTIEIDNPNHKLKPGHTVKADILRFDLNDQIVIPSSTIITKTDKRVVMIAKDGKAAEVEILVKNESKGLALIEEGLNVGDSIIIKGHHQTVEHFKI